MDNIITIGVAISLLIMTVVLIAVCGYCVQRKNRLTNVNDMYMLTY